jgi:hypothetical protein
MLLAGDFRSSIDLEEEQRLPPALRAASDAQGYLRSLRFVAHRPDDEGTERALRVCDRLDFEHGVRTAMRFIYIDKAERARRAGASGEVVAAIEREGATAAGAIVGFRAHGVEYRWELARAVGGEAVDGRRFSWEFRRLREIVNTARRAGVGFERPRPDATHHGRFHYSPRDWTGILGHLGYDGAVPWGDIIDRSVDVMAVLAPTFQTMASPSAEAAQQRMGYIFLHEVLGHAVARLRNRREDHASGAEPYTDADRLAASLARALPGYTTGQVTVEIRSIDVPWNWDPDLGTYDPLGG